MTEKLLKAALNSTHKHTHFFLFLSFRRLAILKFARIPFHTVPHKSHNAINIDFSIAFWYLDVLSGILVAFRYFGAFRSLYAPKLSWYTVFDLISAHVLGTYMHHFPRGVPGSSLTRGAICGGIEQVTFPQLNL